jgi:hypothetical protein
MHCPLCPQSARVSSNARFTAPVANAAAVVSQLFGHATPTPVSLAPALTLPGSIHKRGPPAFLNSL